ncbi:hypothetical protein AVEN_216143-1, partial [Araneus ventricosus]
GVSGPPDRRRLAPGGQLHFRRWEQSGRGNTLRADDATSSPPRKGQEDELSGTRPLHTRSAGGLHGPKGLLRRRSGPGVAQERGGVWELQQSLPDSRPVQRGGRHDDQRRGEGDRRIRHAAQTILDR